MSFLSSITNSIGSVLGFDSLGDTLGDAFTGAAGTVVNSTDPGQKGGGMFGNSNFYGSLLQAGTALAGIYFKQSGDKQLAEEAAKQRMAELAYAAAHQKGGGGGGGGGGSALQIAKMNNLSALYQNYAQLQQKAAQDQAESAIATGKLMTDPINTRLAVLR